MALLLLILVSTPQQSARFVPFSPGDQYRVSTKSILKGQLSIETPGTAKAEKLTVAGLSRVSYRERVLHVDGQEHNDRCLRVYDVVDYRRDVNQQNQTATIRPAVRRILAERIAGEKAYYCVDQPLLGEELDVLHTHEMLTVLASLLPEGEITKDATWQAPSRAAAELADLERIESGSLKCTFKGVIEHENQALAQIVVEGTLVGKNTEGRARNTVRAALYLNSAGRLHSIRALGQMEILGPNDRALGQIDADFTLVLDPLKTNEQINLSPELARLGAPSETQLALLFEHPGLGFRLLYPRRWRPTNATGVQLVFETSTSSIVVHLEADGEAPATEKYHAEVLGHLRKQGGRMTLHDPGQPKESTSVEGRIGRFRIEASFAEAPAVLDHWVLARGKRGATFASRLDPKQTERLAADVELMVRSMAFFSPQKPIGLGDAKKTDEPKRTIAPAISGQPRKSIPAPTKAPGN